MLRRRLLRLCLRGGKRVVLGKTILAGPIAAFGFSWFLAFSPRKPWFLGVGKAWIWISLDFLVRI
jgi:hypothetical protein